MRAPLARRVGEQFFDLGDSGRVDQWPLVPTVSTPFAHLERGDGGGKLLGEGVIDAVLHQQAVGADAGLASVAVLRDAIAPATAASRSASSNTMKGALPPSSIDGFFTVGAHWAMSFTGEPISVEPAKDSDARSGWRIRRRCRARAGDDVEHTPSGCRRAGSSGQRQRRNGVCWPAAIIVQPAASARRPAGDHRRREFHGVMAAADADRLARHQQAAVRTRSAG